MSAETVVPLLWLYGADAVGKSTVAWEVYEQLTGRGVPMAYVDIDYLGFCRPMIGESPNRLVELNFGSMWSNFATAGAGCLIAAGVMVTAEDRRRFQAAIPGAALTLCRLRATPETLRSRIMRRGQMEGAGSAGAVSGLTLDTLSEYADQASRFAAELDADDIADFTVDTDGRTDGRFPRSPSWSWTGCRGGPRRRWTDVRCRWVGGALSRSAR